MSELRHRPRPPAPLVPAALLLAAGIALARYAPLPMGALALLAGGAWLGGAILLRRADLAPARTASLAAALLATGACLGSQAWRTVPADHLAAFVPAGQSPLATLTGRVASTPEMVDPADQPAGWSAYPRPPWTDFLLEANSVTTAAGPRACRGLVRVRVEGPAWDVRAGQAVRLSCRLHRPAAPRNPGQTDARAAGRLHGTIIQAACPASEAMEVLADPPAGPAGWLARLRTHARQQLACEGDYDGRLLARAMVFGVRDRALRGVEEAMAHAGIAHYLSVSGAHLGVLVALAYALTRLARLAPRAASAAVLGLLAAYLLVAEPQAPLLRAAIMAGAFCLAGILGRSAATANLLALAAILLLAADPAELFRPGFQLSFGIVAGILLLTRPVRELLFGRWLALRGLMVFRDRQRVRRWAWRTGLLWTATTVSISIAAWLAGLPLVAYHFGRVAPAGAILTLLLLPGVAAVLYLSLIQLLLAGVAPNLAGSLGPWLGTVSDGLADFSLATQRLAWLSIPLRPVPAWAAVLLAAAILGTAYAARLRLGRRGAAAMLLAVLTVITLATQTAARPARMGELAVLDVGHGQCALFRAPDGRVILLDAGSRSLADPYGQVLEPFLKSRRWPAVQAAFLSHGEVDHYNALGGLLERALPRAIFANDRLGRGEDVEPLLRRLLGRLAMEEVDVRRLARGDCLSLGRGCELTVLWPPAGRGHEALSLNDSSLVLRLECAGTRILLPGDIQHLGQQLLLELSSQDLRAEVLILPHHGSASPALEPFIAAVDPRIIIRSSGRRSDGAVREIPALTTRYEFFSTDRDGAIRVALTADGPVATPLRIDN